MREGPDEEGIGMSKPSDMLCDFVKDDALARKLERIVRAELRGDALIAVARRLMALGPRRLRGAGRRRLAAAETAGRPPVEFGAAVIGRRYLLTPESMADELGRLDALRPPKKRRIEAANDTSDEVRAYAEFMDAARNGGSK